jgi:hypothetical protein
MLKADLYERLLKFTYKDSELKSLKVDELKEIYKKEK